MNVAALLQDSPSNTRKPHIQSPPPDSLQATQHPRPPDGVPSAPSSPSSYPRTVPAQSRPRTAHHQSYASPDYPPSRSRADSSPSLYRPHLTPAAAAAAPAAASPAATSPTPDPCPARRPSLPAPPSHRAFPSHGQSPASPPLTLCPILGSPSSTGVLPFRPPVQSNPGLV
ncbi:hypothetical protein SERLA73DRAFT_80103 [Serpula lacrymans var. lacrymans S7.3]|uniref:Uncharacterized protein n=1 Tax=Serpula lacrymans var. lacrymans (strain S7.3) TaxID=936435 RepID=F8QIQ1_SERL3|nr:hypothetical protein SERLA73DRAFT_80103 [Serpula lacrymans var. lacrymans S7.3]